MSASRALPAGLEDPDMLNLAKSWLRECRQNHLFCRPPKSSFNPTRLVHIVNKNLVRVVPSQEQTALQSYAAFSHCWGKAKTVKLLEANMQVLLQGIPIQELPLSYKEAILVCQVLEISYIWIDSLCIIQDNKDDWTREAAMMHDVYQNSILNICASAAAESSEASFQCRDTSLIVPLEVDLALTGAEMRRYQLVSSEHLQNDISYSPLRSRAWVYQEDTLSKRSLSLTRGQMWWECRQTIACETYPLGIPFNLLPENQAARLRAKNESSRHSQASASSVSNDEIDRKYWRWYNSIEDYTQCGLTQPTDKLVALSGVAQSYRDSHRLQDEDYVAGCWKSQLPFALCWQTIRHKWTYRPPVYIAPSWSWASIQGALYYDFSAEETETASTKSLCQITNIKLHHVDAYYKTGPLRGGCIHLRGHIIGPITEKFEYLTEDDEVQHALQTAYWGFDEISASGYSEASYLDQLEPDRCQDGHVDAASRKSAAQADESPRLSLLPIFERLVGCETFMHGLILGQVQGQPGNVFHRFGSFNRLQMSSEVLRRVPSRAIILI